MLPKLVISTIPSEKEKYREDTAKELGIKPIDTFFIGPQEGSISIDQMRVLSTLFLTRSPGLRMIVIDSFELATAEAQNFMLKMLEEKTGQTQFVLFAGHAEGVIATIRSRAQIVRLKTQPIADAGHLAEAFTGGSGLSFLNSQEHQLKSKEEVVERIEQFIDHYRRALIRKPDGNTALILKKLIQTRGEVQTCNTNPQFAYDILLIFIARIATMK